MSNIYVINEVNTAFYKIGYAADVPSRLSGLQVGNRAKLRLVTSFPVTDGKLAESIIHSNLAYYRERGEWFILEDGYIEGWLEIVKEGLLSDLLL